jgi:prolyl oligopeptidase PreP (S9A serine peptidase family)
MPSIGSFAMASPKRKSNELYYLFTSFLSPAAIYRFSFETKKSELFKEPSI